MTSDPLDFPGEDIVATQGAGRESLAYGMCRAVRSSTRFLHSEIFRVVDAEALARADAEMLGLLKLALSLHTKQPACSSDPKPNQFHVQECKSTMA
jgi:hypothetical protein